MTFPLPGPTRSGAAAPDLAFRLIIITGQEGAGKSTIVRELLPHTPRSAQIDAEDVGQVNPWVFDEEFRRLHRQNVAALTRNFWHAGYLNVIAGSFVSDHASYVAFRQLLDEDVQVWVVQLLAGKEVRDQRRIARPKPSSSEWRDRVDRFDPEDTTLRHAPGDYRYLAIDNNHLTPAETVSSIKHGIPEIYRAASRS